MSNIQKDLFRNKILRKELETPGVSKDENEETDGLAPLGSPTRGFITPKSLGRRSKLQPKSWDEYFKENFQLDIPTRTGKGSFNVFFSPPKSVKSPLFVFHHGAGSSGLSFAVVSSVIRNRMERGELHIKNNEVAGIISFDMRGHGRTVVEGEDDFSLDLLADDFLSVIHGVYEREHWTLADDDQNHPLILVGHSLGGAVVTRAAQKGNLNSLLGVVVLDAVEELALDGLKSMNGLLDKWPKQFKSIESAIDWQLSGNGIRNRESAVVSVPGILKKVEDGSTSYTWRLNLRRTQPFWSDWFTGLSKGFLTVPAARMLILAGEDRLDKDLMIGQMQGKYQLVVFSNSGHFIQEDEPENTALTLIEFWTRNGRPQNIVPVFGKFR